MGVSTEKCIARNLLINMSKKQWGLVGVIVLFGLFFFLVPYYQRPLTEFALAHPILAPLILILWRFIGVVIPPIPAGLLAFALIPVLGWVWVYVYSFIGLLLGACVAFFLARRYREPIVKQFVPLQDFNKWEGRLSKTTEFWGFLVIRLTTGAIMDFVSYLAGLTKLRFDKFFVATVISLIPSAVGYYLGEQSYKQMNTEHPLLTFIVFVVIVFFVVKYGEKAKKVLRRKRN